MLTIPPWHQVWWSPVQIPDAVVPYMLGRSSVKLHIPIDHCLRGLGIYKSWAPCSTETQNGISGNMLCVVWDITPFIYYFFSSLIPQRNSNSHQFSVTSGLGVVLLLQVSGLVDTSCCLLHGFLFSNHPNTSCGTAPRAGHGRHC